MTINVRGKDVELKYSFNSFKYLEEFDIRDLQEISVKPFKLIPLAEMLSMGALNNDPTFKVSYDEVCAIVEDIVMNGDVSGFITELTSKLQDSDFFKQLQKTQMI